MKVAPDGKKAKLVSSKSLKTKSLKAGGVLTKKKKDGVLTTKKRETLLRGFADSSLNTKVAVSKASNGLAEHASSQELLKKSSPKITGKKIENSSTLRKKSLRGTSPPSNKASSNGKSSTVGKQAEAAIRKPLKKALKVKTEPLNPVPDKSVKEEVSSPEQQSENSKGALKRKSRSPVDSKVSSKEGPSAAKNKKLTQKPTLEGQLKEVDVAVNKSVKSPEKEVQKSKTKKKSVERLDVSKDSRLQNIEKAAQAVLTLAEKKLKSLPKKQLFAGDAQPVFLQIHSFRIPRTPPRIVRFNLPHSVYEKTADICLILADPIKGRKRDTEQDAIVENYKEMLEDKGVKNIKEVIPFNYLRAQYSQYEMKRRFANSFDVVLCDSRFVGHATHFLGNRFFTDKCITPIRVVKDGQKDFVDDFKSAIDFALHKTWIRIHSKGTSFNVVVGNTELTSDQIASNVLAVLNDLQVCFPGGLDNIKMALLKCHEANPVPVFVSLKPHNEVPVPLVKSINDKHGEPAIDELSTLPGREVTVYPSGRVDIRNKMTPEDEEYERIMGQESRWKRAQKKKLNDDENNGENDEGSGGEGPEDKPNFSVKRKPKFRGKKTFQNKKFVPKKTFGQRKKISPGKKFSRGNKTNPGKKLVNKKNSPISKKGKKTSQKA